MLTREQIEEIQTERRDKATKGRTARQKSWAV